jgi:apolipoprotein N-acyltransferase
MIKTGSWALLLSLTSGFLLAGAWLMPGTVTCAILGWLFLLSFLALVRISQKPYRFAYLTAVISHSSAFYWLIATIKDFGGFSTALSALIYAFFIIISSFQFIVFVFFLRNLPPFFEKAGLSAALAWVVSETISLRIFPWQIAHTQLEWSYLIQIADIGGTSLISLAMVFVADGVIRGMLKGSPRIVIVPAAVLTLTLLYGYFSFNYYSSLTGEKKDVALVQANISVEQKHNIMFFVDNTESYKALSSGIARPGLLIIWPESVVMDWIHVLIGHSSKDQRLRDLIAVDNKTTGASFLIGALTYNFSGEKFNSALAIYENGEIPYPYHKRILMPFGEYMPLSGFFPWLAELNPATGHFSAGKKIEVFEYPDADGQPLRAAPLICYEDMAPSLARHATLSGAQILVNLTNDAWFGRTVAPYQHHLIAAFRAVENRRYLLRSTNSGLTAIINPAGTTISSLPIFSEGILQEKVLPIDRKSVYTRYVGQLPWWLLSFLCCVLVFHRLVTKKHWNRIKT